MNERSAEAELGTAVDPQASAPPSATKSGVVRVARAERPSWERVDEYLRSGSHREQVEAYAGRDPAFADVLRWMRNEEGEAEGPPPSAPSSSNLEHPAQGALRAVS